MDEPGFQRTWMANAIALVTLRLNNPGGSVQEEMDLVDELDDEALAAGEPFGFASGALLSAMNDLCQRLLAEVEAAGGTGAPEVLQRLAALYASEEGPL